LIDAAIGIGEKRGVRREKQASAQREADGATDASEATRPKGFGVTP
jgi:hypothetical protein